MANAQVKDMTGITTPASTDVMYVQHDPSGTPADRKVTFANLEASLTLANEIGYSSLGTLTGTQTLTNKRITRRVGTTTSSGTPTINTDNVDIYSLTAQAADITSFTTNLSGTPTNGQTLHLIIVGTGTHDITWGASFESSTVSLPTTGAITTTRSDILLIWNAATTKWRCVGVV